MSEVQRLQKQIEGNKQAIELAAAYERLSKNRDFKKLVLEQFMVQECARYVQVSCDPNLDAGSRADALGLAQAAGHLKRYFAVVCKIGEHAASEVVELEAAIVEAEQEEEGGDE